MNEKIIDNNGVSICTESFGHADNPALLLIAGATVSMLYWREEFCQLLADQGLFVIRFDNRDVGRSGTYAPGTTPYTIVDMADDAVAVLDAYRVPSAHFAGMSLGGLIAQIAALRSAVRVKSLTLIATGPWAESSADIPEMDTAVLDFQAKASKVDWANEEAVVSYMLQGAALMTGGHAFDRESAERLARAEFKRANNYLSMFNHAALGGGEAYYNRLHEISQPTLIIHGTDDRIWHFKNTEVLLDKIGGARLIALEGSGHELARVDWPAIVEGINSHVNNGS
ncbi:alpha/beta hydrolase [Pedobacter yulinensis]|uniref:Alpha/beta hydrolase n=1 Tax=Pedobacter yulinensis TaxID=2126353 RepID=A0A2T3HP32_9SPHI|nr:macrolide hydrolase EstT [Pedobacter yulinensis]PST84141.1 alpha/beta hydrolase [Pedobacter yulinensis]